MQRRKRVSVARSAAAGLLIVGTLALGQGAWAQSRSIDALINDTVARVGQSQAQKHGKFAPLESPPEEGVEQTQWVDAAPFPTWAETAAQLDPIPQDNRPPLIVAEGPPYGGGEAPVDTADALHMPTGQDPVPLADFADPSAFLREETEPTLPDANAEAPLPVAEDTAADSLAFLAPIEVRGTAEPEEGKRAAPLYVGAGSPVFPEGIQYVLQGQSHLAYQSNPYRLSESQSADIRGDLALHNEVRAAAYVPLLSERTLAYGSLALGDVRYQQESNLNHHPYHLGAGVRVRAGDWWQGGVDVSDQKRLYRYLGRSWPTRDMVRQSQWSARAGLRLTEDLTLPEVEFMQRKVRYDLLGNQQLYNHDVQQVRVYANLAGVDDAFVRLGGAYGKTDYLDRPPALAAQVGKEYEEKEVFLQWRWRHSVKTLVDGRLGWRSRHYPDLPQRDLSFAFMDLNLGWTYSAKTQFWLNLWNLPYGNEENPFYLYSTLRGVRASVQWAHSPYVWSSMNVVREMQINHPVNPTGRDAFHTWRLGPRFEWQFHRNMKFFADAWHERIFKGTQGQNLTSNVLRVGLVINLDNGSRETQRLFRHAECDPPRYIEMSECL